MTIPKFSTAPITWFAFPQPLSYLDCRLAAGRASSWEGQVWCGRLTVFGLFGLFCWGCDKGRSGGALHFPVEAGGLGGVDAAAGKAGFRAGFLMWMPPRKAAWQVPRPATQRLTAAIFLPSASMSRS